MKKHPYLKQAEKLLSPRFYVNFLKGNVATISFEEGWDAFAHLVIEPDQFDGIILSLSLDFNEPNLVADITISLMHCANLALGETFYCSKAGNTYWGDDASEQFEIEKNPEILKELVPINEHRH